MTRSFLMIILYLLIITSCISPQKKEIDLSQVNHEAVTIKRYEKALFSIDKNNIREGLTDIYEEFSFFLVKDPDTFDIKSIRSYITDPAIIKAKEDIDDKYSDVSDIEQSLNHALKHLAYYYADIKISQIYTYISGFDFEHPIKFADSVLVIGLDMYMGADYYFYPIIGLPKYLTYNMDKDYIVRDCMIEIGKSLVHENLSHQTFLDKMLLEGKIMYFLDAVMPKVPDSIKIAFTASQLDWCERNEDNMWHFFMDQHFLYNNDRKIINRFMGASPFTASFANESPGRTGIWIGWQIIRAYMKNNPDISLQELFFNNDAQEILKKSKYKPKKKK